MAVVAKLSAESDQMLKSVNIDARALAASTGKQFSWKTMSGSAKFFFVVFIILLIVEMLLEALIYFKNQDKMNSSMALGYWIRYVIAAIIAVVAGMIMFLVINVLSHAGWWKLSWLIVFLPFITYIGAFFSYRFWVSLWSVLTGRIAVDSVRSVWTPVL